MNPTPITEQRTHEIVATALVAALTVFNGDSEYIAEERLVRAALAAIGEVAVNSAGEPI